MVHHNEHHEQNAKKFDAGITGSRFCCHLKVIIIYYFFPILDFTYAFTWFLTFWSKTKKYAIEITKDVHATAIVRNESKGLAIHLAMIAANPKLTKAVKKIGRYVFFKNALAEKDGIIRLSNTKYTIVDNGQPINPNIYAHT